MGREAGELMARPKDFDLATEVVKKNFTPARTDAPALIELIAEGPETIAPKAIAAAAGLGAPAREAIVAKLLTTIPNHGGAPLLVQVIGLLARKGDDAARALLFELINDPRVRLRRAAITALGKLGSNTVEPREEAGGRDVELREGAERRSDDRRAGTDDVIVDLRDGAPRRGDDRRDSEPQNGDDRRDPHTDREPRDGQPTDTKREPPVSEPQRADREPADALAGARTALLARWDASDVTPEERRALAESLGKVGGVGALARLTALDPGDDKELARRRDRALLMADRTAKRGEDSEIAHDAAPPHPLLVRLGCRPALGELLFTELVGLDLGAGVVRKIHQPEWVELTLAGPWSTLFRSRLWATAEIIVPLVGLADRAADHPGRADEVATSIVRTLTSPDVLALLRGWTRGAIRWRLGMAHGHQRAVLWRVAKEVTALAPDLLNDPTQTTWDVLVDPATRTLSLIPRRIEDPRFAYRVAEVPAASTGSVAAALVWAADAHGNDRVWDPFCGSGVELVERARRGAFASLLGSDVDPEALVAARANLAAAGVSAELVQADARTHAPGPVDLIISNPPLGSRVHVDAAALCIAALPNFVRALAPKGRLVWITPAHRKTTPVAESLGLELARSLPVDLGGVRGRLERWNKR
jgi:16S rRNA G966 N2-methylase RsmD